MIASKKEGIQAGVQRGVKQAYSDATPASERYTNVARMASRDLGKKIGGAGEAVGSGINKASKAITQASVDNPGALGVTAGAAGLGALALGKLLRRRKTA